MEPFLGEVEVIGQHQPADAERRVARGDRQDDHAEHGQHAAKSPHRGKACIVDHAAGAALGQGVGQAFASSIKALGRRRPDKGDDPFGNHRPIEHQPHVFLALQAAGHQRALGGVKSAYRSAAYRNEDQGPGRKLVGVQVCQRELRHRDPAVEQGPAQPGDHHQQGSGEKWVETPDEHVDRQHRGEEVVDIDHRHDYPQPIGKPEGRRLEP